VLVDVNFATVATKLAPAALALSGEWTCTLSYALANCSATSSRTPLFVAVGRLDPLVFPSLAFGEIFRGLPLVRGGVIESRFPPPPLLRELLIAWQPRVQSTNNVTASTRPPLVPRAPYQAGASRLVCFCVLKRA
jgi:hypothetical protein